MFFVFLVVFFGGGSYEPTCSLVCLVFVFIYFLFVFVFFLSSKTNLCLEKHLFIYFCAEKMFLKLKRA